MTNLILALLKIYKRWFSSLFLSSCRYVPTCSEYAMEAVERRGAITGLALAVSRILRCHPFARGGFDPVPDHTHAHPPQFVSALSRSAKLSNGRESIARN